MRGEPPGAKTRQAHPAGQMVGIGSRLFLLFRVGAPLHKDRKGGDSFLSVFIFVIYLFCLSSVFLLVRRQQLMLVGFGQMLASATNVGVTSYNSRFCLHTAARDSSRQVPHRRGARCRVHNASQNLSSVPSLGCLASNSTQKFDPTAL